MKQGLLLNMNFKENLKDIFMNCRHVFAAELLFTWATLCGGSWLYIMGDWFIDVETVNDSLKVCGRWWKWELLLRMPVNWGMEGRQYKVLSLSILRNRNREKDLLRQYFAEGHVPSFTLENMPLQLPVCLSVPRKTPDLDFIKKIWRLRI